MMKLPRFLPHKDDFGAVLLTQVDNILCEQQLDLNLPYMKTPPAHRTRYWPNVVGAGGSLFYTFVRMCLWSKWKKLWIITTIKNNSCSFPHFMSFQSVWKTRLEKIYAKKEKKWKQNKITILEFSMPYYLETRNSLGAFFKLLKSSSYKGWNYGFEKLISSLCFFICWNQQGILQSFNNKINLIIQYASDQ